MISTYTFGSKIERDSKAHGLLFDQIPYGTNFNTFLVAGLRVGMLLLLDFVDFIPFGP